MKTAIAFFLLASTTVAAEMRVQRDMSYAKPKNERQMLDVYAPTEGNNHPIMVWIHGGAWRFGNKRSVQHKPQAFVDQGFVFISTNYRFVPHVTMDEIAADIARAIKWAHDNAETFGGDPDTIFVGGHSAGAHLSALVCTDETYLEGIGLKLSNIKGCIPVDTAMYDAAKQIRQRGPNRSRIYTAAFGLKEKTQIKHSPLTHVAKGKDIPPFLILHVASRADSKAQSQAFAKALQNAGSKAEVVAGEGKTHGTINNELGIADDAPTKAVFEFLKATTH